MKHRGLKFLSLLLTLALLVGLLPGMSAYALAYNIFITRPGTTDSIQVNDNNKNDVLGDGTVSFFPAQGTTPATLKLNGYNYSGRGHYGNSRYSVIRSTFSQLVIELSGENSINTGEYTSYGIYSTGNVEITGDGKLSIDGGYALYTGANGSLTINDGEITARSTSGHGITCLKFTMNNGTVHAEGTGSTNSSGIYCGGRSDNNPNATINGGTVVANGTARGIWVYDGTVNIKGGIVTASGGTYGIYTTTSNQGSDKIINDIAGTGWTNTAGTEGKTTIAVSTEGQNLSAYKKVQFPAAADSFTVTYDPGRGSGTMEPTTVSKNAAEKYMYTVESCGFTAPEGETFDYWLGSDGKTYRPGPEVEISGDLTLTAQWKKSGSDGGDSEGGSGSGFDLVFNIPGADNSWEYVGGYDAPQQAYRVSLAPMQGGSAALGLMTGDSGTALNVYPSTTVYVFPNAEQGYTLDKIVWSLIDGSASYDITEAKNFVMPAMDVVVYVTFKPVG